FFACRYWPIGWSRSFRNEDVALVAYGPDEPGMLGIGLDLLAQPHDAQIHAAVERVPVPLLVEIQDALARQRAVGVFGERLQQIEFQRRHRDLCALLVDKPAGGNVEHAPPDSYAGGAELRTPRGRRAPQHALDAGHQRARIEPL